ncbi:TolC family protein [Mucisphaera calidilacus]|uniref:Outer membrane channel protein n=1 Tax=Mucisphaera calidilacus TaxID=2527982 RepID=A0A518BU72_9BACT|nr:TolC family protein [Mucisphaera calidilacus]QDU70543.1 outer membrane channel protein [Mucisphaera calidilacus]
MSHQPTHRAAVILLCLALGGCLQSEDTPFLQPDWEQALREADRDEDATQQPTSIRNEEQTRLTATSLLRDDGVLGLSIEHAAMLALSGNRDLAVQQFQPVIVGANERIERGVFDPEFFASADFSEERASEVNRATGTRFNVEGEDTTAQAGIRQTLPTGTDIELDASFDREVSNRTPKQQETRIGLTVTQQLLRDAGPAVNLARIRQARIDTRASVFELRGYAETLLAEVESAYWRYVLARERIAIFQRSVDVARQQRDEVEQRIEVGVLAETLGAAARAEVALRELALIDARSDLKRQRLQLLRLINPDVESPLAPSLDLMTSPVTTPEPIDDLPDRIELAEFRRPDLAEAKLRLEQGRLETLITRNGVLPRLEVFIALGKSGFGDTASDSVRQLDEDSYDLGFGISLSQSLGNDAAIGRRNAAYATRRQSAAAVENLRQLIRLDVLIAANEVERSREQIDATTTARQLQEDTVRAEVERFEAGASTALLVAQAQRDLIQAQVAEVEAVVAYRLAIIQLYLAEGSLLDRRGYALDTDQTL